MSLILAIWVFSIIVLAIPYTAAFFIHLKSPFRVNLFEKWENDYMTDEGMCKFFYIVGLVILTLGMIAAGVYGLPVALGALIGYYATRSASTRSKTRASIDDVFNPGRDN